MVVSSNMRLPLIRTNYLWEAPLLCHLYLTNCDAFCFPVFWWKWSAFLIENARIFAATSEKAEKKFNLSQVECLGAQASILSYAARYTTPFWTAAATLGSSGAHLTYFHKQTEDLSFGVEFECNANVGEVCMHCFIVLPDYFRTHLKINCEKVSFIWYISLTSSINSLVYRYTG